MSCHAAVARRIPGPTQQKPNWLRLGPAVREQAVCSVTNTAMNATSHGGKVVQSLWPWCFELLREVQRQLELLDKEPRLGLGLRGHTLE